jgi:hypothetical protein
MLEEAADGTLPGPNSRVSGRGGTLLKTGVCEFRALATDVDLQGKMSGWDLALRAREVDPAFPVVCMTRRCRRVGLGRAEQHLFETLI